MNKIAARRHPKSNGRMHMESHCNNLAGAELKICNFFCQRITRESQDKHKIPNLGFWELYLFSTVALLVRDSTEMK